jgi:hypothetical protein
MQATWNTTGCGGPLDGSGSLTDQGFAMTSPHFDGKATGTGDRYQALLAVSEAIVSHRELSALFHELAGRLHQVVRFDYLALFLHEPPSNTMRRHILEASDPAPLTPVPALPLEDDPAGWVWQTQ